MHDHSPSDLSVSEIAKFFPLVAFQLQFYHFKDDDFGEIAAGVGPEDYYRLMEDVNKMDLEMELARDAATTSDNLFGREREPTPFLNDAHAPGNAIFGDEDFAGGDMDDDDHNVQGSSGFTDNNAMHMEDMDYESGNTMMRGETPLRSDTPNTFRAPSPAPSIAPSVATSVSAMEHDTIESYYERQAQKRAMQKEQNMRKRRVDDVKMITGEEMKGNMADFRYLRMRKNVYCKNTYNVE